MDASHCNPMRITAETKKAQVIGGSAAVRQKILSLAESLPPAKQERVYLGVWTVRQLLAHLTGWDYANLEGAQAVLEERLPAFYAHHDRDWKSFNAILVQMYSKENFSEQIALSRKSHQELAAYLETLSANDFCRDTGVRFHGWRVTIERLLRAETSDEGKHYSQILELAKVE
jgi:hypothetical protein